MGYDVHITRRKEWSEESGSEIGLEEWLELVRSDPEMRLEGHAEAQLPDGKVLRVDEPTMAVWIAHSRHAWMWHRAGNVEAKNPDAAMLRKMWQLAQKLGARLQGDEGELYGADGQVLG